MSFISSPDLRIDSIVSAELQKVIQHYILIKAFDLSAPIATNPSAFPFSQLKENEDGTTTPLSFLTDLGSMTETEYI